MNNEYEWEIELDHMKAQLRFVLDNIDSIEKRTQVRHKVEDTNNRIGEMVNLCKGERE